VGIAVPTVKQFYIELKKDEKILVLFVFYKTALKEDFKETFRGKTQHGIAFGE
jgi:hypothetical protein